MRAIADVKHMLSEVFIEAETWKKFSPNITEEKAGNKSLSAGATPFGEMA